ncbi:MAG: shikimate kinase [Clostridia bacterium]|nr:shikimate kinase [Clostridia bacterium]
MGKVYLEKYKKEQFKNVYFITGTATGGKTTISKALAEKYGWLRYDVDERFDEHKKLSNPTYQPNMNKTFKDADEFFLRDTNEYVQWLKDNSAEQMEFILADLVELSKNQIVVCDLHLTVEEAEKLANPNQVVFLMRENNDNIIDDYCHRPSHVGFNRFIHSSTNPTKAKQNCNEVLRIVNEERCQTIKNSQFFYIERNENSTVENTLAQVEQHFGLIKSLKCDTKSI